MTTIEQAAHCVSLILSAKLALVTFSLEEKAYIDFHLLSDNVKKHFADTVVNRLNEFIEQVDSNCSMIEKLCNQVKKINLWRNQKHFFK